MSCVTELIKLQFEQWCKSRLSVWLIIWTEPLVTKALLFLKSKGLLRDRELTLALESVSQIELDQIKSKGIEGSETRGA